MGWYLQMFLLANSNEWQSSYIFFSDYLTLIGYIGQTIAPMQFDTVCFPLSWCAECMFNMQAFLFHLVQGRNWFLCPCSLISPLMVKLVLLWTASTMLTPCIVLFAALNYYQHFIYSISWSLIQRPDPPGNKEQPEYFQIHWWVVDSYLQSLWYFYPMGCSLQSSKA